MFDLNGFWLLAALAVVYLVGVFTSQWLKDKIAGIPADLRKALKSTETAALNELTAVKAKVVANTATLLSDAKQRVINDVTPKPAAVVQTVVAEQPITVLTPAPIPAPAIELPAAPVVAPAPAPRVVA